MPDGGGIPYAAAKVVETLTGRQSGPFGETYMTDTDEQADAQARLDVAALRERIQTADPDTLALLLTEARTHYGWRDKPVDDAVLHTIYDIAKMGPTSMNQQPMRLVFIKSDAAKAKLLPALNEANQPKMMAAPVTAIVAYDTEFYEFLPQTMPIRPAAKDIFANNADAANANMVRNGTLQGAYFMIAARAVGLDVGAMSGFNNAKVDETFFTESTWRSNFLCNLGYADESKIFRRMPRLDFDQVAKII